MLNFPPANTFFWGIDNFCLQNLCHIAEVIGAMTMRGWGVGEYE